jgi:hypothetical protein
MFNKPSKQIQERIEGLRAHLSNENPLLVQVIGSFQELDKVAYRLGLLSHDESFATRIAWWPLISILGTFSAGKSTFINQFVGMRLQETGNQAVDDKFTVICYSEDQAVRVLPGLALDADPRFPFYQISEEIEKVTAGEGGRVDTYLQLKTCPCEQVRGRIMIDSPGFDADEQRASRSGSLTTSSTSPIWCWCSSMPATQNPVPCATRSNTWWRATYGATMPPRCCSS